VVNDRLVAAEQRASKTMVSAARAFASITAPAKRTAPASLVLVTVNVAPKARFA
jgi:hypothetical protein